MKKRVLVMALVALVAVALPGCVDYEAIPVDYSFPVVGEEAYDDIVPTPGFPAYRANVHEVGKENPWPHVETVEVELRGSFGKAWLRYRAHIETKSGETRNNVFLMWREGGFDWRAYKTPIEPYTVSIPPGIEISQSLSGSPPGTLATVLVIEIAPEVAPGQYVLEIGLSIQNQNYGIVPCIIEVVE